MNRIGPGVKSRVVMYSFLKIFIVVLLALAFIDATKYIPAQVSDDICSLRTDCLTCATNILLNTRHGRRIAQAALELCRSLERRDLRIFISIMSLNAELVACRTPTPCKSRQHKRRWAETALRRPKRNEDQNVNRKVIEQRLFSDLLSDWRLPARRLCDRWRLACDRGS